MSLFLVAAVSFPSIANDPNNLEKSLVPVETRVVKKEKKLNQETFADSWDVFEGEVVKEVGRRRERFKDNEESLLLENYISRLQFDPTYTLDHEQTEMLEDFVWDIFEDAGKEFIDAHPAINELENELKKNVSYEVAETGKGKKKDYFAPDLSEEDRLEKKQEEEVTTFRRWAKYFGDGYEMKTGVKPYIHHMDVHMKAYAQVKNLDLWGRHFRKAKLEINSEQELKFKLQKFRGDGWYSELSHKMDIGEETDETRLSLTKAYQDPQARVSFYIGRDNDNECKVGMGYMKRF